MPGILFLPRTSSFTACQPDTALSRFEVEILPLPSPYLLEFPHSRDPRRSRGGSLPLHPLPPGHTPFAGCRGSFSCPVTALSQQVHRTPPYPVWGGRVREADSPPPVTVPAGVSNPYRYPSDPRRSQAVRSCSPPSQDAGDPFSAPYQLFHSRLTEHRPIPFRGRVREGDSPPPIGEYPGPGYRCTQGVCSRSSLTAGHINGARLFRDIQSPVRAYR